MGVIHAFQWEYRKQGIQKATAMIEGELLVMQDHLTCEGEEKQEEEKEVEVDLIENKVSFFSFSSRTRGGKKIHPAVECEG
jgi:hypothetical protein